MGWGWRLSISKVLEDADLWVHRLLCAWQCFTWYLFETPGKNYISLLCQMKQDLFRFHQLETGMVIASCTRNHNRLKARFWRLELGFRWNNNYANIPEHLPPVSLLNLVYSLNFSPLIKLEYKHHSIGV